jgi:hypothetical protein
MIAIFTSATATAGALKGFIRELGSTAENPLALE